MTLPSNLMLSQPASRIWPLKKIVSFDWSCLVLTSDWASNASALRGPTFSRSMQTKTPTATPASNEMRPPHVDLTWLFWTKRCEKMSWKGAWSWRRRGSVRSRS